MLATAMMAGLVGVLLCALIVGYLARRLCLPVREALMWFGLLEVDTSRLARAAGRRRS